MSNSKRRLPLIEIDPWLEKSEEELLHRHNLYLKKIGEIEQVCGSIVDYANGYLFFGFQRDEAAKGWWFREWLPGAKSAYLFGDFNGWERKSVPLQRGTGGVWAVFLSDEDYGERLLHGSLVKLFIHGDNGWKERIPAYIRRAVQDDNTKDFSGQLWNPEPFDWSGDDFDASTIESPIIYEAHVGMAQESEGVGTYDEFTKNILPIVKEQGYNTIQLMAIAEHPYYGSYGYHVSSFFAPSSRFGTPEELKNLIKRAHEMGIAVIMDIVHSHYVKNINEGLNELDGTDHHYSKSGEAGYQPYWDSMLFDYGKGEVSHFLLSNIKYWLDEFHFDGFRFDGVTSMIFHHHGYTEFDSREKYFDETINHDALTYLTLANKLVHEFSPKLITIAEDVSGMPGMCNSVEDGGVGFDYRLGMAVPDFWIEMLEDVPDEEWDVWDIWKILTDRLPYVKTITYAESHDQALVGDKTIAFRLMDRAMYTMMDRESQSVVVDRGIALHKMIRLITISLGGQGYLNFMGNEFGHPEWIDFPREGNNWSYAHARRQWSLRENQLLKYSFLNQFDREMIELVKENHILRNNYAWRLLMDVENHTMAYSHGDLIFVFNWHPSCSTPNYRIPISTPGKYRTVLTTDAARFGGQGRQSEEDNHFSTPIKHGDKITGHYIQIYNVCRTAVVFKREE